MPALMEVPPDEAIDREKASGMALTITHIFGICVGGGMG